MRVRPIVVKQPYESSAGTHIFHFRSGVALRVVGCKRDFTDNRDTPSRIVLIMADDTGASDVVCWELVFSDEDTTWKLYDVRRDGSETHNRFLGILIGSAHLIASGNSGYHRVQVLP